MCKKLGIAALLVAAGVFAYNKTDAGSYANALWERCRTKAVKQVSLDFEIERIRRDIDKLIPDMKKNLTVLAKEMVDVENLQADIAMTRENLAKQKVVLKEMKDAIQSDVSPVVFHSRVYRSEQLRERLARELATCQRCEETLKYKEQLLEAKEQSVEAAKEQLTTIRSKKQELEVQVAQLEADIKTLRVAQARSKVQIDDSRLAKVKQSIEALKNRMRVEQRESELVNTLVPEPFVTEQPKTKTTDQVLAEVDAYLNGAKPEANRVVERK